MPQPALLVIMGVSGSGKSTVGELLADRLDLPFVDADDLHPATNVAKMSAGEPLTDEDRWPWLAAVGSTLALASASGLVVACSALKIAYRDAIRREAPDVSFVHLTGSREVLESRMGGRTNHFMPATLLDSQLATLEPLQPSEGITVDIAGTPRQIVDRIVARR